MLTFTPPKAAPPPPVDGPAGCATPNQILSCFSSLSSPPLPSSPLLACPASFACVFTTTDLRQIQSVNLYVPRPPKTQPHLSTLPRHIEIESNALPANHEIQLRISKRNKNKRHLGHSWRGWSAWDMRIAGPPRQVGTLPCYMLNAPSIVQDEDSWASWYISEALC